MEEKKERETVERRKGQSSAHTCRRSRTGSHFECLRMNSKLSLFRLDAPVRRATLSPTSIASLPSPARPPAAILSLRSRCAL